jgi:hypothetical protein
MEDEEHIEIKTKKEIYNKRKPVYALRKEDFIPIIGLYRHHKRCLRKSSLLELSSDWYASQCWIRDCELAIYNIAILAGTITGIVGLEKLLSK